jgi:hypothetical protein
MEGARERGEGQREGCRLGGEREGLRERARVLKKARQDRERFEKVVGWWRERERRRKFLIILIIFRVSGGVGNSVTLIIQKEKVIKTAVLRCFTDKLLQITELAP